MNIFFPSYLVYEKETNKPKRKDQIQVNKTFATLEIGMIASEKKKVKYVCPKFILPLIIKDGKWYICE